jgi:hypothetical protein
VGRIFQDDLPSISISRLRATGAVTAEMARTMVGLGGTEVEVDLSLLKFPNGGSWSFFLCPQCGLKARTLRLLDGSAVCRRCCIRRGIRCRCEPISVRQRAELRIPKLRQMLESEEHLRFKPHLRYSKLERRSRLEMALRRAELLVGHTDFVKPKPGDRDVT